MNKASLILLTILFSACGHFKTHNSLNCDGSTQLKFGHIKFMLPSCYSIWIKDSINHPNDGFVVKGDSVKLNLEINASGHIGQHTDLQNNKSVTLKSDTINGHFLRQIGYYSIGSRFGFMVNIVDLNEFSLSFAEQIDSTKDNFFNKLHTYELIAYTNEAVSLSIEERNELIKAFRESALTTN